MSRRAVLLVLWVVATAAATAISWRGVRLVTASVTDAHTAIPQRVVAAALTSPVEPGQAEGPGRPPASPGTRSQGTAGPVTTIGRGATPEPSGPATGIAAIAGPAAHPAAATGAAGGNGGGSDAPSGRGSGEAPTSGAQHTSTPGGSSRPGAQNPDPNAAPSTTTGGHSSPSPTSGTGGSGGGGPNGSSPGGAGGDTRPHRDTSGSASSTPTSGTTGQGDPTTTYAGPGGQITVACDGQQIRLVSAAPNDGYRLIVDDPGPDRVDVTFANQDNQDGASAQNGHDGSDPRDEISASCEGGQPQQS